MQNLKVMGFSSGLSVQHGCSHLFGSQEHNEEAIVKNTMNCNSSSSEGVKMKNGLHFKTIH